MRPGTASETYMYCVGPFVMHIAHGAPEADNGLVVLLGAAPLRMFGSFVYGTSIVMMRTGLPSGSKT